MDEVAVLQLGGSLRDCPRYPCQERPPPLGRHGKGRGGKKGEECTFVCGSLFHMIL